MANRKTSRSGFARTVTILGCALALTVNATAADGELTAKGKALEARYTTQLNALRTEILEILPVASPQKLNAYLQACKAEQATINEIKSVTAALAEADKARALVRHAKNKWIGGADKAIAAAEATLKKAATDAERDAARKELAELRKNRQVGVEALKERQAVLDKELAKQPQLKQALETATSNRDKAKSDTLNALKSLGTDTFLADGTLDAYWNACKAEQAAEEAFAAAQKSMAAVGKARGLVGHAKNKWIAGADKGIAKTEAALKAATTDVEREAARKQLVAWRKNRQDGLEALKERQALLDKALAEEPALQKALDAVKAELATAKARTLQSFEALGLAVVLRNEKLDAKLVKFVILHDATPRGLATFAQQSNAHEALIETLFADPGLMKQMLMADGAKDGKYYEAMKIYSDIQKASPKANKGTLQRLALAVSLEHAVPVKQRNAKSKPNAPATVDPVKRYLSYEKAFLAGELDPAFKDFDAWEYRFVIYAQEPDEVSDWGRQMLRNYRPDHITTPNYRWRYMAAVRTEIKYRFGYDKDDVPNLQFYQNILMNGGVCGRRAFFGRFILRAFGIPTTARPQPGHAALAHWTPEGWIVCLGGGWGSGWTKTQYRDDRDFLATTQARENKTAFMQVKRAQWIGAVFDEEPVYGLFSGNPGFWYGASLRLQRQIIEKAKMKALAAVGEELGEANESKVKYDVDTAEVTDKDRQITIGPNGVITVPAVACTSPLKSTNKILFMPSNLGGKQLHYNRNGKPETFSYAVDVPKAGNYALTARLVTPTSNQILVLSVNDAAKPISIALPFTVGMWETLAPVEITLKKGKNVVTFSRAGEKIYGLTIRDFTLTPVE